MSKLTGRTVDDQTRDRWVKYHYRYFYLPLDFFLKTSDASNDNMTEENLRSSKIEHFLLKKKEMCRCYQ